MRRTEWSPKQVEFQIFLATPPSMRPVGLRTEEELAAHFDVPLATLVAWKAVPGWWDETARYSTTIVGDALSEILQALTAKAKTGNIAAIKLSLEYMNLLKTQQESTIKFADDGLIIEHRIAGPPKEGVRDLAAPPQPQLPAPQTITLPTANRQLTANSADAPDDELITIPARSANHKEQP